MRRGPTDSRAKTDHSGVPGRSDTFTVDLPLFSGVSEAVEQLPRANASLIFVPPPLLPIRSWRRQKAGVELIVCITEGVPVNDIGGP